MGAGGRLELAAPAGRARRRPRVLLATGPRLGTPGPEADELRILVTELTMASGTPAAERLLEPEIHLDDSRVLLRLYIKPLEGYVGRAAKQETPVIVRLAGAARAAAAGRRGGVRAGARGEVSCWSADQQLNGRPSRQTSASRTRR